MKAIAVESAEMGSVVIGRVGEVGVGDNHFVEFTHKGRLDEV